MCGVMSAQFFRSAAHSANLAWSKSGIIPRAMVAVETAPHPTLPRSDNPLGDITVVSADPRVDIKQLKRVKCPVTGVIVEGDPATWGKTSRVNLDKMQRTGRSRQPYVRETHDIVIQSIRSLGSTGALFTSNTNEKRVPAGTAVWRDPFAEFRKP